MRTTACVLAIAAILPLTENAVRAEEDMLAHDVYFSLKDNSPQAQKRLIAACQKYLSGHPGTVWFAAGPRAAELKREVNDLDFDVALHVVFKNDAAHQQYQKAERHLKFIEENKDNWKKVRVFDSLVAASSHAAAAEARPEGFSVQPIGRVEKKDGKDVIVLDKKHQAGLLGLEKWSHVQVLWWFDKNDTPQKRAVLQVHPRGDEKNPLTGVFACRAPVRPNLIALSLCKVVSVKENVVEVEKIDAFEGTPVLDLKPFAPGVDSASGAKVPSWAGPK